MDQIYRNRKKFLCGIEYHLIFFKDFYIYIIYSENFDNQCILIVYETAGRIFYNYTCKHSFVYCYQSSNKAITFKLFLDIEIVKQSCELTELKALLCNIILISAYKSVRIRRC